MKSFEWHMIFGKYLTGLICKHYGHIKGFIWDGPNPANRYGCEICTRCNEWLNK